MILAQNADPFGSMRYERAQHAPPTTADLLCELIAATRQVSRQLAELPSQLAAVLQTTKPAGSITDDERRALEEIFQTAFPSMSPGVPRRASAADLIAHVRSHAPNSTAADMLGTDDTSIDHAKRLGRLLSRADGLVIGEYILRAGKKVRGATIWQVSALAKPA